MSIVHIYIWWQRREMISLSLLLSPTLFLLLSRPFVDRKDKRTNEQINIKKKKPKQKTEHINSFGINMKKTCFIIFVRLESCHTHSTQSRDVPQNPMPRVERVNENGESVYQRNYSNLRWQIYDIIKRNSFMTAIALSSSAIVVNSAHCLSLLRVCTAMMGFQNWRRLSSLTHRTKRNRLLRLHVKLTSCRIAEYGNYATKNPLSSVVTQKVQRLTPHNNNNIIASYHIMNEPHTKLKRLSTQRSLITSKPDETEWIEIKCGAQTKSELR